MIYAAFDIETMANVDMIEKLPEPKVALGNLKDQAKIDAKIAEAKKAQIDKMALSPWTGKLCAFSFVSKNADCAVCSEDEKAMLENIFKLLDEYRDDCLITFNGIEFDLPYIYGRAVINGIVPIAPLERWTKRYKTHPHLDLRAVLTNWKSHEPGSFDFFLKMILDDSKAELDYSKFPEMIKGPVGRREIEEGCRQHTLATYELARAIAPAYLGIVIPERQV